MPPQSQIRSYGLDAISEAEQRIINLIETQSVLSTHSTKSKTNSVKSKSNSALAHKRAEVKAAQDQIKHDAKELDLIKTKLEIKAKKEDLDREAERAEIEAKLRLLHKQSKVTVVEAEVRELESEYGENSITEIPVANVKERTQNYVDTYSVSDIMRLNQTSL